MKVAVIHDWLLTMRGGEKVLEAILEIYPEADLFTLIYKKGFLSPIIENRKIFTSPLQKIPGAFKRYKHFLPFFPRWIEQFDLSGYDLIISSSSCVAKGVKKRKDAKHVAYVHAPMRYMWDRFDDYFSPGNASKMTRMGARFFRTYLRNWDRRVSQPNRVNQIVANSRFIAKKIEEFYGRNAEVIYPFVDLDRFSLPHEPTQKSYFLCFGALVPYKRIDLVVKTFRRMGLPLVIGGEGPESNRLKAMAKGNIEFLGRIEDEKVLKLFQNARALIFPGEEDFGIIPLEAMACGLPVIAYKSGGAVETVTSDCGVLFPRQDETSLEKGVREFITNEKRFLPENCRKQAERFTKDRFIKQFSETVKRTMES